MISRDLLNLCICNMVEGLREGLSHFSGLSRVALIYALSPGDPMRIYDPQGLLRGHEPRLEEHFLVSRHWLERHGADIRPGELAFPESLPLAGLISYGVMSHNVFHQMWFSEHHPDMCSIGPTMRWFERAASLLDEDMGSEYPSIDTSSLVLREYATHAVRDYLVDERNLRLGIDSRIRIYPLLDAVLGISNTPEEGARPRGRLVFVEPHQLSSLRMLTRFPALERPMLRNYKHVRKLLTSVENSARRLVSDGQYILGIATGQMPVARVTTDFRDGYGYLRLEDEHVCSFADGAFSSSFRRAKLVQVEEALLEAELEPGQEHELFGVVAAIVHSAQDKRHGCTLVIDLNELPLTLSGQPLNEPLDLGRGELLDLAKALSHVDGALHIHRTSTLHAFGCLLDGPAVPGENRARGARFNSALRFTAAHESILAVVVSSDRPVSILQNGVELTAICDWRPASSLGSPPLLGDWIRG